MLKTRTMQCALRFWYLPSLSSFRLLTNCKRCIYGQTDNIQLQEWLACLFVCLLIDRIGWLVCLLVSNQIMCIFRMSLEMLNSLGWFLSSSFLTTSSSSSSPLSLPSGYSSVQIREGKIRAWFKSPKTRSPQVHEGADECDWSVCNISLLHQPRAGGPRRFWNHWKDWKNYSSGKHWLLPIIHLNVLNVYKWHVI